MGQAGSKREGVSGAVVGIGGGGGGCNSMYHIGNRQSSAFTSHANHIQSFAVLLPLHIS